MMERAGETVRRTGLYRVTHQGHRGPHEAIVWEGESFPSCSKCRSAVTFEFLQPAPEADEFEHVGYDGDFLESVLSGYEPHCFELPA
jgi:hypothetical protein